MRSLGEPYAAVFHHTHSLEALPRPPTDVNSCVFPLSRHSAPVSISSLTHVHYRRAVFEACALFPSIPGSLGELLSASVLALYHTQSRCSIMNECICCRINTQAFVFAGTRIHLFLKPQSKIASSELSLFGRQTQGGGQRCVPMNSPGRTSMSTVDSQGRCLSKARTL